MSDVIVAATITVCGTLATAVLNNWGKIIGRRKSPRRVHSSRPRTRSQLPDKSEGRPTSFRATAVVAIAGLAFIAGVQIWSLRGCQTITDLYAFGVAG